MDRTSPSKFRKESKCLILIRTPYGDEIEIKNFEGEIEVSTVHNGVVLTNTTGPMEVKTVHGDIEASLGATH
jgi:DUF4097 and DUF4098 domain-containing protein YvlB